MSYNFHCYVFNPANIFLIEITLQNIDIVSKNYILVTDCRKIKVVHFLDVKSDSFSYIPPQFGAQVTSDSCRYDWIVKQCQ